MRLLLISILCCLLAPAARAQTATSFTGGIRVGYSDTEYKGIFRQVEGMVRYDKLPFWHSQRSWTLRFGVEVLAGALENDIDTSALVGGGLHLTLGLWQERASFDTGSAVAMISDHTFGRISLGAPAQFITHWRLRLRVLSAVAVAYRYQHMSNGGLGLDNPGLNLHMLELTIGH